MSAGAEEGKERAFAERVSNACHDLRTPLATVFGFARTLQRHGGLDERQANYVGMVVAASEELMRLIDDLAVLARIESGTFVPRQEDVQLRTLAAEAAAEARERLQGSRDVRGPRDELSGSVRTDRKLACNALASLAEGALRIEPPRKGLSFELADSGVELGPLEPRTVGQLVATGEDLRVVAARAVLAKLGARLTPRGERLGVAFTT